MSSMDERLNPFQRMEKLKAQKAERQSPKKIIQTERENTISHRIERHTSEAEKYFILNIIAREY